MKKEKPTTIDEAIMLSKEGEVKPRLLLHTCCAPCASGVLSYIAEHFDITLFFYNPNIMPNEEFKLRLDTLKTLLLQYPSIKLIVPPQSISTFTT
ncbi:MAG: epoxyqueuosine reductase QueH, partial [Clostridia bacterium]